MTIDKAIEIQKLDKDCKYEGPGKDLEDAIQLGIEALEAIKEYRRLPFYSSLKLLPGETNA